MNYTVTSFSRLDGSGVTAEFRSEHRETIAYLDHYPDGKTGVVVFDPYNASRRIYSPRDTHKAMAILHRHLAKLGYTTEIKE